MGMSLLNIGPWATFQTGDYSKTMSSVVQCSVAAAGTNADTEASSGVTASRYSKYVFKIETSSSDSNFFVDGNHVQTLPQTFGASSAHVTLSAYLNEPLKLDWVALSQCVACPPSVSEGLTAVNVIHETDDDVNIAHDNAHNKCGSQAVVFSSTSFVQHLNRHHQPQQRLPAVLQLDCKIRLEKLGSVSSHPFASV
jgi:hypothetical protein